MSLAGADDRGKNSGGAGGNALEVRSTDPAVGKTHSETPHAHQAASQRLTRLIERSVRGDARASEELWRTVYEQLRVIARRTLRNESQTPCQPTTLVHEAYLRLVGARGLSFRNRRHFFGAAARAMRQILVDESRRRRSLKRGGGQNVIPYEDSPAALNCEQDARTPSSRLDALDLIALSEALDRLEAQDARLAEIVNLRFFGGLTVDETAELLGLSPRTVASDWAFARAWLSRELRAQGGTRA